jgi:hypothetical protein
VTGQAASLALLLERVVDGAATRPDPAATAAVLEEAERFAAARLAPLATIPDREGAWLEGGRVRLPAAHAEVWRDFAGAGWAGLAAPEEAGGAALPLAVASAVQEVFDAAHPAFGMLAINARCAMRLLQRHADPETRGLAGAAGGRTLGTAARRAGAGHRRGAGRCADAREGGGRGALPPPARHRLCRRAAAGRAGPLAPRYAALAGLHAAEAEARAGLLAERCRRNDLDTAFAAVFTD